MGLGLGLGLKLGLGLGLELGEVHLHAAVGAEELGRADGATAVDQRWAAEGGGLDERHAVGVVSAGVHVERGACEDGAERLGPEEALDHDGRRVGGEQPGAHACGVALVGGGAA